MNVIVSRNIADKYCEQCRSQHRPLRTLLTLLRAVLYTYVLLKSCSLIKNVTFKH